MGKLGRKRPLSRPRRKWDYIIKIDHQNVEFGRMDSIWVGQDRDNGRLGGERPLSRPRRKWNDVIEIDIQEVGCGRMDCIGLGQDREMKEVG
jgi:hypothetical protein